MQQQPEEEQPELQTASGRFYLRGRQLRVSVSASPDALTAEVESAGRLWAGEFDAAYLEELTRKTGSYKRYEVFVGMLLTAVGEQQKQQKTKKQKKHRREEAEAAGAAAVEQLSLDLMTLDDLKALRAQRLGGDGNSSTSRSGGGEAGGKRYLILTYRTRFDQVHYPLALAHQGRVSRIESTGDDDTTHRRDRRQDVDEAALTSSDADAAADAAAAENAELRAELARLRRQLATAEAASTKYKREAEELRAGERLLRLRVRQLTHELALMRRRATSPSQSVGSRTASPGQNGRRSRPASASVGPQSPSSLLSPRIRNHNYYNYQQQQQHQQQQYARYQRHRSPSPRPPHPPNLTPRSARPQQRREPPASARHHQNQQQQQQQQRRRPRSNSCPRFDPTAYIAEVERRRQESRERRRRDIAERIRLAGAPSPPPSSVASSSSRRRGVVNQDSFDGTDFDDLDDPGADLDNADSLRLLGSFNLTSSSRRRSRPRQARSSARRSTPATAKSSAIEGYEEDIQQIDERLDRLQSFLNKTLLIH